MEVSDDLYMGSFCGVKILTGLGSKEKNSVEVDNSFEFCYEEQRKGMVSEKMHMGHLERCIWSKISF